MEPTVMFIVELPEPGAEIDDGLKLTVTPDGWPDADKAMDELKPPEMEVEIVDEPLLPSAMETEVGEAEMVKDGLADELTVSETDVVCVIPPPTPLTVMV